MSDSRSTSISQSIEKSKKDSKKAQKNRSEATAAQAGLVVPEPMKALSLTLLSQQNERDLAYYERIRKALDPVSSPVSSAPAPQPIPILDSNLKLSYVVSKDFSKTSLTSTALALFQQINNRLSNEAEFDSNAFELLLAQLQVNSDSNDSIKSKVLPYMSGYLQFLFMELLGNENVTYRQVKETSQKLFAQPLFFYKPEQGLVIVNMSPNSMLNVFQIAGFMKDYSNEMLQALFQRYAEALDTDHLSISCELLNLFKQGPAGRNYLQYLGKESDFATVATLMDLAAGKIAFKASASQPINRIVVLEHLLKDELGLVEACDKGDVVFFYRYLEQIKNAFPRESALVLKRILARGDKESGLTPLGYTVWKYSQSLTAHPETAVRYKKMALLLASYSTELFTATASMNEQRFTLVDVFKTLRAQTEEKMTNIAVEPETTLMRDEEKTEKNNKRKQDDGQARLGSKPHRQAFFDASNKRQLVATNALLVKRLAFFTMEFVEIIILSLQSKKASLSLLQLLDAFLKIYLSKSSALVEPIQAVQRQYNDIADSLVDLHLNQRIKDELSRTVVKMFEVLGQRDSEQQMQVYNHFLILMGTDPGLQREIPALLFYKFLKLGRAEKKPSENSASSSEQEKVAVKGPSYPLTIKTTDELFALEIAEWTDFFQIIDSSENSTDALQAILARLEKSADRLMDFCGTEKAKSLHYLFRLNCLRLAAFYYGQVIHISEVYGLKCCLGLYLSPMHSYYSGGLVQISSQYSQNKIKAFLEAHPLVMEALDRCKDQALKNEFKEYQDHINELSPEGSANVGKPY